MILVIGWISKTFIWTELQPAFIGALVAAAGAVFAACIAYTAARENLEMANQMAKENAEQRLENQKQQKAFRIQQAKMELKQTREVLAYLDRLLANFEGAGVSGEKDYVAFMRELDRAGGIVQYMGPVPHSLHGKVQEIFMRFNNIKPHLNMVGQGGSRSEIEAERAALNSSLRDRIAEVRKLRGEIDENFRHQEREIYAMEREQA